MTGTRDAATAYRQRILSGLLGWAAGVLLALVGLSLWAYGHQPVWPALALALLALVGSWLSAWGVQRVRRGDVTWPLRVCLASAMVLGLWLLLSLPGGLLVLPPLGFSMLVLLATLLEPPRAATAWAAAAIGLYLAGLGLRWLIPLPVIDFSPLLNTLLFGMPALALAVMAAVGYLFTRRIPAASADDYAAGLVSAEHYRQAILATDNEGQVIGANGVLRDITDRKRAIDQELRRRAWMEKVLVLSAKVSQFTDLSACLRTINESVRCGLEFDRVGVFLYDANENVLRGTFGTGPTGELVDTSWYSEPLYPVTQQILSDPKGFVFTPDFTAQFNVPPGDEMYGVKGYVMVAAWAGEKPIAMIAADNGITGRRMTEDQIEALRLFAGYVGFAIENARLYAARQRELAERERVETEIKHSRASRLALTENTYDAIWSVDRHFKFLTFNSGFVELYRQFYDKVLDPEAGLDERLPISEAAYWRNAYTRALSGERFVSEYSVTLQGQQRSFEYAFNPIEADGQITGVAVFSRDITERKRTEAELQERERFLTLLNDITRAALETPTLKQMLQTLADRSAELFHADNASITLWDAESEVTLPMASSAPELRDAFRTLRPEPRALTVTAAVLRAGHALAWTM